MELRDAAIGLGYSEAFGAVAYYSAYLCVATRRVTIFYNCIGAFEVPDRRKIPEADILMETRKGIAVNYAPAQTA